MTQRLVACLSWCSLAMALPASAQRIELDASIGLSDGAWRAGVSSQWRRDIGSRITLGTGLRVTHYDGEAASFRNQGATTTALPDRLPIDPLTRLTNTTGQVEYRDTPAPNTEQRFYRALKQ